MEAPPPPRYGQASLADLVPSLLSALGVPGFPSPLLSGPLARACLLLVDGLGWEMLRRHRAAAPFLFSQVDGAQPLTTGFPSTTAVSLSSLGTGRTPGEHGIVGYTMAVPGLERSMNVLRWALHGSPTQDLVEALPPEEFFAPETAFERAVEAGVQVTKVGPIQLAHTGLTRAVLRGGHYRPAFSLGDLATEAVRALGESARSFVYAYTPDLDATGHARGVAAEAWRLELAHIDRLAADIASALPADAALVVTGDHGMVDVPAGGRYDLADHPDLRHGVRLLGGEPRARHVYTQPGAESEVLAAWQERLGDQMWILTREQAMAAGWFGPQLPDAFRDRIGDLVAAAHGPVGVTERQVFPLETQLIGHHGSLTAEEQLVPFVVVRR
jgi:hypothetical protein